MGLYIIDQLLFTCKTRFVHVKQKLVKGAVETNNFRPACFLRSVSDRHVFWSANRRMFYQFWIAKGNPFKLSIQGDFISKNMVLYTDCEVSGVPNGGKLYMPRPSTSEEKMVVLRR
jgi:hypothetical protein